MKGLRGRDRVRRCSGTTIAEAPLAMWIIIVGMMFPLVCLVMIMFRYGLFWNAAREAAQQAGRAPTFLADPTGPNGVGGISAVNAAQSVATLSASAFTGITLQPIRVYIITTNLGTAVVTKNPANTPLSTPADPVNNVYDVLVELRGQMQPFVPMNFFPFSGIAGLGAPISLTACSQYSVEIPQGLNQ